MNAYNSITPETIQEDMRYLQLLSHSFPYSRCQYGNNQPGSYSEPA